MAKILVTGATGFLGTHLVPQLRVVGHEVVQANSSLGDVAEATTWSHFPPVEVVIHLAGKTFVPDSWTEPAAFVKTNLLGTIAALGYCKKHNSRLVFLSSYLYGNPQKLPTPETAPLIANNPYALSKILAEDACRFYSESFGINITILRPFNVYGPKQPEHFLIPSIIRQVKAGEVIQVKDLEPKRDYVYIDDLVDAIVKAIDLRPGVSIFNIGTGKSYSVAELIKIIQDIKGTKLSVKSSTENRRFEVMNTIADITQAKEVLGWQPQFSLEEGIQALLRDSL
jgi:nucleoside-diphosphate-sugar epimerase